MEPSPPVTGRRRGIWFRFGSLIAISFLWVHYPSRRTRGTERDGESICCCPYCFEPGYHLAGPLYQCDREHDFTEEQAKQGRKMKKKKEEEEKERK
jgi:hypothetical protein